MAVIGYLYNISTSISLSCNDACDITIIADGTCYASTTDVILLVGQYLFTNASLTTPLTGAAGWHKLNLDGSANYYSVELDESGLVLQISLCVSDSPGSCDALPSPTPTMTPTSTPCDCVGSVNITVTVAGDVLYFDCYGNINYQTVSTGAQVIVNPSGNAILRSTLGGSAVYTITTYGFCTSPVAPTPTPTPTLSPSPTTTATNTPTQTNPPTNTASPSPTSSLTPTPSATPIVCGQGITTGSHFYYDCCGNLISGSVEKLLVSIDYTRPYLGVALMNTATSVVCATPTSTPTPSITPSITATMTQTPTSTLTPSPTPTATLTPTPPEVLVLQNNCDVVTIFPLGVVCNVVNPTSSTSFDGVLSVIVTGGTSPYSILWDSGQIGQTIVGVPNGSYGVTVVDFYGDYTASTVCTLMAPTASPTPTNTSTPTPTPTPSYPNLCFFVQYGTEPILGPLQFLRTTSVNGRPSWIYNDGVANSILSWNIQLLRWEISPWTFAQGILVSNVTSMVPTSGWVAEGNPTTNVRITVSEGTCPDYAPLTANIVTENTTCGNTAPYDGGITITPSGGLAPYTYSIDNGVTFSNSNVFTQLRNSTYTVIVKDSAGNTFSSLAVVGSDATSSTYQISVVSSGVTVINQYNHQGSWAVEVTPPIPVGVTLNFTLSVDQYQIVDGPGTGIITGTTSVYKNGTLQTTTNISTSSTVSTRPNCSPETRGTDSIATLYSITMGNGDVVSGVTSSIMSFTDPQVGANGCATNLYQSTNVIALSPIMNNCACCTPIALKIYGGVPDHDLGFVQSEPIPNPTVTLVNLSLSGNDLCTVCNLRTLPTSVYTYERNSPTAGLVLYQTNTLGVLSNPFNGGGNYYKFFWGGNTPTDFDVIQISDIGEVMTLIDCQSECVSYSIYSGCGTGFTESSAASDATTNNRTFWSDCNSLSFGSLCTIFTTSSGGPLLGVPKIFINSANYDINPSTGVIIGLSEIQV